MSFSTFFRHLQAIVICLAILLTFSSCSSSSKTSVSDASSVSASSVESSKKETHPFVYSDATWSTTQSEIEKVVGMTASNISFSGGAKKTYTFDNTSCESLNGTSTFIFKDSVLCKTTFSYASSTVITDASTLIVDTITEAYGQPTTDKSDLSEDGAGVWLTWETDDCTITYFYYVNPSDSKYNILIGYELPEAKLPAIDISSRSGDFRVAYWGDDLDTVNKYETAEFEGTSSDLSSVLYNGQVAGYNAYIAYYFDSEGKLYRGGYTITDTFTNGSYYISAYNTIKDGLTSKYGSAEFDKKQKLSSLADYTDDGTAVQLGYVIYRTEWTTETTKISLNLANLNHEMTFILVYTDLNYQESANTTGL